MKKAIAIIVLGLLWCSNIYAASISDLLGIFGDDLVYLKCDVDVFKVGKIKYPFIGIGYNDGDIEGVHLSEVDKNSPAWQAGLIKGDIIVGYRKKFDVNEKVIKNQQDFTDATRNMRVGDLVVLRILREGKRYRAHLTVGEKQDKGFTEDEVRERKRFRYLAFKDEVITRGETKNGSKGYMFSNWWAKANNFQDKTEIAELNQALIAFHAKPGDDSKLKQIFFLHREMGRIVFRTVGKHYTSCNKINKNDLPTKEVKTVF